MVDVFSMGESIDVSKIWGIMCIDFVVFSVFGFVIVSVILIIFIRML